MKIEFVKKIFVSTLVALAAVCAQAATETVDGIKWTYTVADGKASVGGGSSSSTAVPKTTSGAIIIPSTLGGCPVTSIGDYAFEDCSSFTSVTIPDSVTSIGEEAFEGCESLTSVTIGKSVTSIGKWAFYNCSSLTSVTIPDSVTSIGYYAFEDCSSLTSVTIGDGVTSIGNFAFRDCSSLTSVTIGDGVTSIGNSAFCNCSSLTSITIPDSVTSIGIPSASNADSSPFQYCSSLENIIVDEDNSNYKSVDGLLYSKDGKKLISCPGGRKVVTIPDGVTRFGEDAFCGCSMLVSVTIPEGVNYLSSGMFRGCSSLMSVTIPDSVFAIDMNCFSGCSSLVSVMIPDNVSWIGSGAFIGCSSLTSVTIPDSVTSINDYTFYGCSSLKSVTIPDSVTSIGEGAFEECSSLKEVYIKDLAKWCAISFESSDSNPLRYGGSLYISSEMIVDLIIPSNVTKINSRAFNGCSSLTSITIPDSVTSIGDWAFDGCSSLTKVIFEGDAPGLIGARVFSPLYTYGTVYVKPGSTGWDVEIPGKWKGVNIDYIRNRYNDVLGGRWNDGIVGRADVNGDDGTSVKFTADDSSSVWIETEVTNACRVTFKWKSSCEPLVKGSPYDYFSFEVDGVQKGFVCGETPWSEFTIKIDGEGVHRLKWCFQRDDEGDGGDNCAWLADLDIVYVRTVRFDSGGASEGTVPEQMLLYEGSSITIPDQGSLLWPRHTFSGWSDGNIIYQPGTSYSIVKDVVFYAQWYRNELAPPVISGPETFEADSCTVSISAEEGTSIRYTLDGSYPTPGSPLYVSPLTIERTTVIKAVAFKDNYFDSGVAAFTVTRGVWTFGEYLNWPEQELTTGGDAEWIREKGVSDDGYALRNGDITHSQKSKLETVVYGQGKISFKCRVEGEILKKTVWDGLAFCIDGIQQGDLIGDADWVEKTYTVSGSGAHTLAWIYQKDEEGDGSGEDCAWLDEVVWMPTLPELSDSATTNHVVQALRGVADAKLAQNIKTVTEYSAFRAWALGLAGATLDDVNDSPNAWLSYALDTEKLIEGDVTESRLKVSSFNQSGENNLFSIKLVLDGVDIGSAATVENLLKIFAVEGAKELDEDSFSAANVVVDLVQPNDGEVEFVVAPRAKNTAFFFRARMREDDNGVGMNRLSKVQLWEEGPYWATTNIGAEEPEDYGYYFWWGDTVGYKWENNKWVASDGSNSNFSFTSSNAPTYGKYTSTLQSGGWITADGVLSSEHDAAHVQWGGEWRMPTYQELNDLCDECDWTWTTVNGVNGYVVRGRGEYASNSIFLPCAGRGNGTSLYDSGSRGYYWSSVPYSYYYSWGLDFGSSDHGTDYYLRLYGQSVRPVQGFTK